MSDAATSTAVADSAVADGAALDPRPLDAGMLDAGPSGAADASALDAVVVTSDSGTDAASPLDATLDAQPGPDAAGGSDAGGVDAGPVGEGGSVDYAARGPHEVITEKNVGSAFRNNVDDDTFFCNLFIGALGGSNPDVDEELTTYPSDMNRGLYTLFRPKQLEAGKTYPLLTWGNGTCSHPLLFSELIEHVVSHGYIVIASNSRQVGDGRVMLRGIDFMLAENQNVSSPFYGKIDAMKIGAFGHSQGSMATVVASADSRIVASVPIQGASATEVRNLKGPTFLIAGEKDTIVNPSGIRDAFNATTVPAVYGLSLGQDHLMPGVAPQHIWDAVTAWFKAHLERDAAARAWFYGADCRLCKDARWQVQRKNQ